jgi:hypothetical protein
MLLIFTRLKANPFILLTDLKDLINIVDVERINNGILRKVKEKTHRTYLKKILANQLLSILQH